jgi:multidrug efflux pump subunit AcrA (membrane-fusion protein)
MLSAQPTRHDPDATPATPVGGLPAPVWAAAPARAKPAAAPRLNAAGAMLVLQSRALTHERFAAAAASVVADLAVLLRCERVSLGLKGRQQVHVASISGVTDLRTHQNAVRRVAQAMHEALEQRSAIVYPLPPGTAPNTTVAHAALAEANGRLSICTLPIICGERAVGTLLFERRNGFDAAALQLAKDAALFIGPVLVLMRRAEDSLQARLAATAGAGPAGQGHSPWRLAALTGAIALGVLGAWPTTYRVVAPARVEGAVQRVIAAPVDGFVRAVAARPGEAVRAGQVIVQLEDQDLNLEREKWESEIAQLDKQYREALSKDEAAQIVVASSKLEQARTQLDLAQRQLERTRLKAPFDGVLISGDLSQSIGMPVKRGQELMTVATDRSFRIVAEVDEQDVAALRVGQNAQVMFAALPQPVGFVVARIAPVANTADGRNVFEIEGSGVVDAKGEAAAAADANAAGLSPGLRGIAKVDIGASFVAVVWWQRASHWLRRTAWRLSG